MKHSFEIHPTVIQSLLLLCRFSEFNNLGKITLHIVELHNGLVFGRKIQTANEKSTQN